ncbi:MAG: DUF6463 family protein [Acidobacteria bacterium]|nr:DUF6463 family protein [Acidobacteriota bacterium]
MLEADLIRLSLGPLFLIGLWIIVRLGKRKAGRLFMLIGVLHVLGGAWVGREPLVRILREGFFGEADSGLGNVPSQVDKELVFWFMLWGVYAFLFGQFISWLEGQGKRTPAFVGWELVVINLLAAALIPKAGFWLVLIPSFLIIRDAKKPLDAREREGL